jgi:hypothetical protein
MDILRLTARSSIFYKSTHTALSFALSVDTAVIAGVTGALRTRIHLTPTTLGFTVAHSRAKEQRLGSFTHGLIYAGLTTLFPIAACVLRFFPQTKGFSLEELQAKLIAVQDREFRAARSNYDNTTILGTCFLKREQMCPCLIRPQSSLQAWLMSETRDFPDVPKNSPPVGSYLPTLLRPRAPLRGRSTASPSDGTHPQRFHGRAYPAVKLYFKASRRT